MREIKLRFFDKLRKNTFFSSECSHYEVWGVVQDKDRFVTMEYTGLKDKNGVEIYEGDLLDFDEREWGGKFDPEVITFDKIIGGWNLCGSFDDVISYRQVVGNIYDNPELLEQSK